MLYAALALWAVFLVAAAFYTRRARNPQMRPLAAYLIFVVVFTAASFVLFVTLTFLAGVLGRTDALAHPVVAVLFLAAVFVPAFLAARWQFRKPPRGGGVP